MLRTAVLLLEVVMVVVIVTMRYRAVVDSRSSYSIGSVNSTVPTGSCCGSVKVESIHVQPGVSFCLVNS